MLTIHDMLKDGDGIHCYEQGIGNGLPLAAVVTTPEVAQVLAQRLHFNTYGGNPVCCAGGRAVLRVVDEDGIQANAAKVRAAAVKTTVARCHDPYFHSSAAVDMRRPCNPYKRFPRLFVYWTTRKLWAFLPPYLALTVHTIYIYTSLYLKSSPDWRRHI